MPYSTNDLLLSLQRGDDIQHPIFHEWQYQDNLPLPNAHQFAEGVEYKVLGFEPLPAVEQALPIQDQLNLGTPCWWPDCNKTFTREKDCDRHMSSVHFRVSLNCTISDCHNNRGKGYSRADKLHEHQRKHHATKRQSRA